jgi:hypothetical protein
MSFRLISCFAVTAIVAQLAVLALSRPAPAAQLVRLAPGNYPEGIAFDQRIPGHAALGISPLVHIDPVTGEVTSSIEPGRWTGFGVPLSLTFGVARDRTSIFATNGDLPGIPPEGRLPGVIEVNVGVPGASPH